MSTAGIEIENNLSVHTSRTSVVDQECSCLLVSQYCWLAVSVTQSLNLWLPVSHGQSDSHYQTASHSNINKDIQEFPRHHSLCMHVRSIVGCMGIIKTLRIIAASDSLNPWHPAQQQGALPTELTRRLVCTHANCKKCLSDHVFKPLIFLQRFLKWFNK